MAEANLIKTEPVVTLTMTEKQAIALHGVLGGLSPNLHLKYAANHAKAMSILKENSEQMSDIYEALDRIVDD